MINDWIEIKYNKYDFYKLLHFFLILKVWLDQLSTIVWFILIKFWQNSKIIYWSSTDMLLVSVMIIFNSCLHFTLYSFVCEQSSSMCKLVISFKYLQHLSFGFFWKTYSNLNFITFVNKKLNLSISLIFFLGLID